MYDTNAEPVFLSLGSHSPGAVITLDTDPKRIWVVVEDDQDTPLHFDWSYGNGDSREDRIDNSEYSYVDGVNQHSSTIYLPADADTYDGKILSCVVFDDGGNEVAVDWPMEVPQ